MPPGQAATPVIQTLQSQAFLSAEGSKKNQKVNGWD
jgi:hypothetical protein